MSTLTVEDELREARVRIQRLLTSRDHWHRQAQALATANAILRLERRMALSMLAAPRAVVRRRTNRAENGAFRFDFNQERIAA